MNGGAQPIPVRVGAGKHTTWIRQLSSLQVAVEASRSARSC